MKIDDDTLLIGLALVGLWALLSRAPAIAMGTRQAAPSGSQDAGAYLNAPTEEGAGCECRK